MRDGYTFIVARILLLTAAFLSSTLFHGPLVTALAQTQKEPGKLKDRQKEQQVQQQQQEQEPPEEDVSSNEKEYAFNPLQAEKELKAGAFYFKKGSYKAASRRFSEATKWNPSSAEAFLRLAQSEEKLKDAKAAHDAYAKYLELAPDSKDAESIRKKLERHP